MMKLKNKISKKKRGRRPVLTFQTRLIRPEALYNETPRSSILRKSNDE